ncbi:MAG TPA: polysaccharide deacetylase family protein [Candidatus Saccharimonadales bacterium]|nr:polysaccharide deacetylase family protein [Candidatus Saccharimonadales bacterium]
MRIDRSLTMGVFHPLQRLGVRSNEVRLPILMYHSLSDDPENGVAGYYKTNTASSIFRQHLAQLAEEGYKTIDFPQLLDSLGSGQFPSDKSIVITFDDGFKNFYTEGFPALSKYGFTATMFLPTAFISNSRMSFKEAECLTWNEIREMRQAGMQFGSHTVNHPQLSGLKFPEIERELRDSRAQMEQELGEPTTTFAYPFAFPQENRSFAQTFRDLLIKTGYTCCVTTEVGRVKDGDDRYRLKRLPANSQDDPALFRAKLEGGYDWLGWPQAISKTFKRKKHLCEADAPA